ncbi:MAG: isoleucine--tRNA ligase, partial [Myxococcota bacterium]
SNFEANSDYREVQDPAITVAMPVEGGDDVLLIWTTTPWTLPSNLAIAVGADIDYVRATRPDDDTVYVVAEARMEAVLGKDAEVVERLKGAALAGTKYRPLFPYFVDRPNAFQVIEAPHVTTDDGTGLVHMAPDFGEEDFVASRAAGIDVLQSVDFEGRFKDVITDFAGRNVKEADPDIIRWIKDKGRMFHHGTLVHQYPFCWRSETPLIYLALPAWFVKVSDVRDRMVKNNQDIHWVPDFVGSKRFGNWLEDARDWNVSRNRFWGTPIPIWECSDDPEHRICIGSVKELEEHTGKSIDDIHPHRIDDLTFDCPGCGGTMKRITEVFDCWFESGSMPYAQSHYPFEGEDTFERRFPAQFIAEGLDQTRGWFYTLLVLGSALFERSPFENVVVNGMVLAEDGSKMSKSKKNYPPPEDILDNYGADALRAYLVNSPVVRAEKLKFAEQGVQDVIRMVLLPLHNAHSFFVQYANIDAWSPTDARPPVAERPELDRWLVSHLQSLIADVDREMELYHLYNVVPRVLSFIDDLTNWYIRLSRRRFWRSGDSEEARHDKSCAYATLYETLVTFTKVLAPILPFSTEALYQSLVVAPGCQEGDADSVHLCDWPVVDETVIDRDLETQVQWSRDIVRLGRRLRERHKLKTRQPLGSLTVVHHEAAVRDAVEAQAAIIADELNVKAVVVQAEGDELASLTCKPNFKTLGRRFGKQMKDAAKVIGTWGTEEYARLQAGETIEVLGQDVAETDVDVRRESREDVVIETEGSLVVAFDTALTDGLVAEGMARELVSAAQQARKDQGLEVTDRVALTVTSADATLRDAVEAQRDYV